MAHFSEFSGGRVTSMTVAQLKAEVKPHKKLFGRRILITKMKRAELMDLVDELREIQDAEIQGEGIGRSFKKLGRSFKKASDVGTKYVHKNAGKWVEQGKKLVPKELVQQAVDEAVKSGITAAATMSGQPELLLAIPAAQKASQYGTNQFYKHDFKKPLPTKNQVIRHIGKKAIGAASKYAEDQLNISFGDDELNGGSLLSGLIAKSYNPVAKAVLDRNGDDTIVRMQIVRTPLNFGLTSAINYLSGGSYAKAAALDKAGKFYHLNANIFTSRGAFTVEKTEVVTLKPGATPTGKGVVTMDAPVPAGLTIRELMDNTQGAQGSKFWTYSASSNNCQYFLRDMLTASGMGSPGLISFAKQETEAIFAGNPTLRKVANSVTDIASVFSTAASQPAAQRFMSGPSLKPSMPKANVKSVAKKLFGWGAAPLGGSAAPLRGRGAAPLGGSVKLVKGSQEAKDHMAMLRAKRKVSGGSVYHGRGYLAL